LFLTDDDENILIVGTFVADCKAVVQSETKAVEVSKT
ncbi:unnamed protein product, partial [marine sediment metagenome]